MAPSFTPQLADVLAQNLISSRRSDSNHFNGQISVYGSYRSSLSARQ
jgi:hypothetical protein